MISKQAFSQKKHATFAGIVLMMVAILILAVTGARYMLDTDITRDAKNAQQIFQNILAHQIEDEESTLHHSLAWLMADRLSQGQDKLLLKHWQQGNRQAASDMLGAYFHQLYVRDYITHLYLTNIDRTVFLRLHQPDRYGDRIDRSSMLQAERTQQGSYGVELGPLGTMTLRHVMPWMVDGELKGYWEIGLDMQDIVQRSILSATGIETMVVLHKSQVTETMWQQRDERVEDLQAWDTLGAHVIIANTFASQGMAIANEAALQVFNEQWQANPGVVDCLQDVPRQIQLSNKQSFSILCYELRDSSDQHLGYIATLHDTTTQMRDQHRFLAWLMLVAMLSMGFVIFMFKRMMDAVEKDHDMQVAGLHTAMKREADMEHAKAHFISMLDHTIRTPMRAIVGLVDILLDTPLSPEQKNNIQVIRHSCQHVTHMMHDVFDYIHIENHQIQLHDNACSINDVLQHVSQLYLHTAQEKHIEIVEHAIPHFQYAIHVDQQRLTQLLGHILRYMIQASPQHRSLVIKADLLSLSQEDEHAMCDIHFEIRHDGMDMSEAAQQRLKQSLAQSKPFALEPQWNDLLGLCIASSLLHVMGSELHLDTPSETEICFWFDLRLQRGKPLPHQTAYPKVLLDGFRVLVVDDCKTLQEVLRITLSNWGLSCDFADSAEDALTMLERAEQPYDLVLTDYLMPGMDGLELTHRIRMHPAWQHMKVLVMSVVDAIIAADVMQHPDIDGFVHKPVHNPNLYEHLISLLVRNSDISSSMRRDNNAAPGNEHEQPDALRFMVVDDVLLHCDMMQHMLNALNLGCHVDVDTFTSAQDAIDHFREQRYDMVFMDLQMPGMNGLETTGQLREIEHRYHMHRTPVIAMATYAQQNDRDTCLAWGMDGHVTKPVKQEQLKELVLQMLAGRLKD